MHFNRMVAGVCLSAWVLAVGSVHARTAEKAVLVIPERYRAVQFAQDIIRLRPVQVVMYTSHLKSGKLLLYAWDSTSQLWRTIQREDYELGGLFGAGKKTLVLIGADADLPATLPAAPAWAQKVERIQSFNAADLANGLDPVLHFTSLEWRWLAKRYGLTIVDQNAERRRYGKYGPPGSAKKPADMTDLPDVVSPAILPPPQDGSTNAPAAEPAVVITPAVEAGTPSVVPPAVEVVPPAAPEVAPPAALPVPRPEDK
jgi:hypothetical protein